MGLCDAKLYCCAIPLPAFLLRWRGEVLVLLVSYTANKHCLICSGILKQLRNLNVKCMLLSLQLNTALEKKNPKCLIIKITI